MLRFCNHHYLSSSTNSFLESGMWLTYDIEQEKVEECYKQILKSTSDFCYQARKRKFWSIPGSPNGVMDVCFSSDSSNDSWAAVASVSSSPEPLSKRIKGAPDHQHCQTFPCLLLASSLMDPPVLIFGAEQCYIQYVLLQVHVKLPTISAIFLTENPCQREHKQTPCFVIGGQCCVLSQLRVHRFGNLNR